MILHPTYTNQQNYGLRVVPKELLTTAYDSHKSAEIHVFTAEAFRAKTINLDVWWIQSSIKTERWIRTK